MTPEEITVELDAAKKQMSELLQDKVLLDLKIGQLSQTINTLMALLQPKPNPADIADISGLLFNDTSITGAIRTLLLQSQVPLSPTQIRTQLISNGFDLSEYQNEMAVIHNTLKRLEKQGELMTVNDSSGQTVAYTMRFLAPVELAPEPRRESWRGKRAGDVTGPTSAHDSGMRGSEKPKK
ncbi:MAG: hypothetical protein WAM04_05005 [Candidatus Sulfotelmatobacter sp.]